MKEGYNKRRQREGKREGKGKDREKCLIEDLRA